jgi:hypothetical protein
MIEKIEHTMANNSFFPLSNSTHNTLQGNPVFEKGRESGATEGGTQSNDSNIENNLE